MSSAPPKEQALDEDVIRRALIGAGIRFDTAEDAKMAEECVRRALRLAAGLPINREPRPTKVFCLKVLYRLKSRFAKERNRLERWAQDKDLDASNRDRARYEATQWGLAVGMLDREIRRTKDDEGE